MSSFLPNTFAAHIDKAVIPTLPVAFFEGEVIVVDRPEMVAEAAAYLRQHNVLGVDMCSKCIWQKTTHLLFLLSFASYRVEWAKYVQQFLSPMLLKSLDAIDQCIIHHCLVTRLVVAS